MDNYPFILRHPFFVTHPRLQRWIDLSYRALTNTFTALVLGLGAIGVTLADYFKSEMLLHVVLAAIFMFWGGVLVLLIYLVSTFRFSYTVLDSDLVWKMVDESGSQGTFSLSRTVVLNRDTDIINTYFGLDEFVFDVSPFNIIAIHYEGCRKKVIVFLGGIHSRGHKVRIESHGKRELDRLAGCRYVEVPFDFVTEKHQTSIMVPQTNTVGTVNPSLAVRSYGEYEIALAAHHGTFNHYVDGQVHDIRWKIKQPPYGSRYLIRW